MFGSYRPSLITVSYSVSLTSYFRNSYSYIQVDTRAPSAARLGSVRCQTTTLQIRARPDPERDTSTDTSTRTRVACLDLLSRETETREDRGRASTTAAPAHSALRSLLSGNVASPSGIVHLRERRGSRDQRTTTPQTHWCFGRPSLKGAEGAGSITPTRCPRLQCSEAPTRAAGPRGRRGRRRRRLRQCTVPRSSAPSAGVTTGWTWS